MPQPGRQQSWDQHPGPDQSSIYTPGLGGVLRPGALPTLDLFSLQDQLPTPGPMVLYAVLSGVSAEGAPWEVQSQIIPLPSSFLLWGLAAFSVESFLRQSQVGEPGDQVKWGAGQPGL